MTCRTWNSRSIIIPELRKNNTTRKSFLNRFNSETKRRLWQNHPQTLDAVSQGALWQTSWAALIVHEKPVIMAHKSPPQFKENSRFSLCVLIVQWRREKYWRIAVFAFMHLANFSSFKVFPGNRTHSLWIANALPVQLQERHTLYKKYRRCEWDGTPSYYVPFRYQYVSLRY